MAQTFWTNRSGNFALTAALLSFPLFGAAALAIDYTNLSRSKWDLQNTADAAVLMAARASLEDEETARAAAARIIDELDDSDDVEWNLRIVDGEIQLSISRNNPMTLSRLFGPDVQRVGVASHATATQNAGGGMELALVLDVSNSMKNRMTDLKLAANGLVDTIYGDAMSLPNVEIALVPFSGRVNIVDYGQDWMSGEIVQPSGEGGRSGAGNDQGKGKGKGKGKGGKNGKDDGGATGTHSGGLCTGWRSGTNGETDAPPSEELLPRFGGPSNTCPASKMIALTDSRAVIQSGITALTNTHGTSTHVGLLWGWRALSPRWQGLWRPEKLDVPKSHAQSPGKHLVIMTDGANHPEQSGDDASEAEVNAQLIRQCSAMRAEGYTIYAVTYYMNGILTDLYSQCTGDSQRVYDANSANELSEAFEHIGGTLVTSALRLSR